MRKKRSTKNGHVRMDVSSRQNGYDMNYCLQWNIVVATMEGKMIENWLKWFGHKKGSIETLVRREDSVVFSTTKREEDKPRTTLQQFIRRDDRPNNIP